MLEQADEYTASACLGCFLDQHHPWLSLLSFPLCVLPGWCFGPSLKAYQRLALGDCRRVS